MGAKLGEMTLAEARRAVFEPLGNGSGDLDYDAWWITLSLYGVPMKMPNPPAHGRALRLHDLHHVLTGYDTSILGECELSAWELAGGSGWYVAAIGFDLAGTGLGAVLAPRRTFRAFLRGRRCTTLFHVGYSEALLAQNVADVRSQLGLDGSPTAGLADRALFALYATLGVLSLTLWPVSLAGLVLTCLAPAPTEPRQRAGALEHQPSPRCAD